MNGHKISTRIGDPRIARLALSAVLERTTNMAYALAPVRGNGLQWEYTSVKQPRRGHVG